LKAAIPQPSKRSSEKLNEAAQLVGQELYKALPRSSRQRPQAASRVANVRGRGWRPQPEGGKKDEGPIIDAEVVDEKSSFPNRNDFGRIDQRVDCAKR